MVHVWNWYCELSAARTSNGFGLNPISYTEIDAWVRLLRIDVVPWEIRVIKNLDSMYLQITNAKGK